MERSRRGSVMIHVLITAIVVSIIAAGLARMLLLRAQVVNRSATSTANRKLAEGALSRVISAWNKTNSFCTSFPGYTCSGAASCGTSVCTCNPTGVGDPTIKACQPAGYANCVMNVCTPGGACSCP